jgi:hypothetical protein
MYSYHATIPVSWLESNHQQRYLDSVGYFCSDVELKMAFLFNSLISRSSRSLLAGPGVVMELLVTLLSHCDDESGLRYRSVLPLYPLASSSFLLSNKPSWRASIPSFQPAILNLVPRFPILSMLFYCASARIVISPDTLFV